MTVNKKTKITSAGDGMEKNQPFHTVGGKVN
jgi:hypothetical protein